MCDKTKKTLTCHPTKGIKMKYLLLLASLSLAACSSFEPPNVSLETDKQAYHMTRAQVILGINECESAGTRPVVITAKRRINGTTTDVPVEVTCNPRYKIFH
jgi:uncharacterized protein YcfL